MLIEGMLIEGFDCRPFLESVSVVASVPYYCIPVQPSILFLQQVMRQLVLSFDVALGLRYGVHICMKSVHLWLTPDIEQ